MRRNQGGGALEASVLSYKQSLTRVETDSGFKKSMDTAFTPGQDGTGREHSWA
jgi:hypothetical protein